MVAADNEQLTVRLQQLLETAEALLAQGRQPVVVGGCVEQRAQLAHRGTA